MSYNLYNYDIVRIVFDLKLQTILAIELVPTSEKGRPSNANNNCKFQKVELPQVVPVRRSVVQGSALGPWNRYLHGTQFSCQEVVVIA